VFLVVTDDYSSVDAPPVDAGPIVVATPPPVDTGALSGAEIFANNRDAVLIIRGVCADGYSWTGSGFIVHSSGVAITNHHVMYGLVDAVALLYDGREFNILGYYSYDFGNDLAVIQLDGSGFDYVIIGNSDATRVGENVFAIGGPDWDPITFTPGMISRIANEPITFNMYSISGMLQSTAAIYGGNSGGPLLNDRGQVIGVNAAGHMVRASVQFAVPINRIIMPGAGDAVNPLPVGRAAIPGRPPAGEVLYYARFPFIPDFMSVSRYGTFSLSGTPADLGLEQGDVLYDFYSYLYIYDLLERYWVADTDIFDAELFESGFNFQNVVQHGDTTWVYFFHPGENYSLSYAFLRGDDILVVAIVEGDVYEHFYHGGGGGESSLPQHDDDDFTIDFTGHPLIGNWAWDQNDDYIYEFRTDGSGTRGFSANRYNIYWYVYDDVLLMDVGGRVEEWSFVIDGNVLTINSLQAAGVTWSYIRE